MTTIRRPLAALLIESAAGHTGTPLTQIDFEARELMEAGQMHRVLPALRRRMHGLREASGWMPMLDAYRHQQLFRHLQASHDLKTIAHAFANSAVRWAVSKGPALSHCAWPDMSMREYFDLDVFIHPEDFRTALSTLEQNGFTLVDRNWPEIQRLGRAELALQGPSGFPLDMHWDIATTKSARRAFTFDLPEMLSRTQPLRLDTDVVVPIFDPTDLLLHVAFHAAQAGANKLVWIADIYHASHAERVDLELLQERALRTGTATPISVVLSRVERTFGVRFELPDELRKRTYHSLSGRMAARREHRWPFPGLPGDPALSGLAYSSARDSNTRSALTAMTQWFDVRRIEARVKRNGPDRNPLDTENLDAFAREEYLADVEGTLRGALSPRPSTSLHKETIT